MSIKGNWRRHGSEVVIRWCQRFFFSLLRDSPSRLRLSILSPTTRKKTSGTQGTYRVDSVYIYHFSRNLFEKPTVLYLTTYSEVLALFISYSDQTLYHSNFASSDLLHFFWVQSRLWLRKHLCSATSFPSQITISMISGNSCNREPLVRTATTLRAKSLKVSFVFNLV